MKKNTLQIIPLVGFCLAFFGCSAPSNNHSIFENEKLTDVVDEEYETGSRSEQYESNNVENEDYTDKDNHYLVLDAYPFSEELSWQEVSIDGVSELALVNKDGTIVKEFPDFSGKKPTEFENGYSFVRANDQLHIINSDGEITFAIDYEGGGTSGTSTGTIGNDLGAYGDGIVCVRETEADYSSSKSSFNFYDSKGSMLLSEPITEEQNWEYAAYNGNGLFTLGTSPGTYGDECIVKAIYPKENKSTIIDTGICPGQINNYGDSGLAFIGIDDDLLPQYLYKDLSQKKGPIIYTAEVPDDYWHDSIKEGYFNAMVGHAINNNRMFLNTKNISDFFDDPKQILMLNTETGKKYTLDEESDSKLLYPFYDGNPAYQEEFYNGVIGLSFLGADGKMYTGFVNDDLEFILEPVQSSTFAMEQDMYKANSDRFILQNQDKIIEIYDTKGNKIKSLTDYPNAWVVNNYSDGVLTLKVDDQILFFDVNGDILSEK